MSHEAPLPAGMPPGFDIRGNELCVAGTPVSELAARVGDRPFYAYDSALMSERVRFLRTHLPAEIDLHYAIKANPMPAVVQHMSGLTEGLDVASAAELGVALSTGVDPLDISFAGPGKSARDLEDAVSAGVIIILESFNEMERVAALAAKHHCQPPVAVRVNPDFELKSSGMKMGGGPRPFGVDAEDVPELLQRIAREPLRFMGLHIFTGSQNLRHEALIEAHDQTFALAQRLAAESPMPIQWLNIGGGLGIPYFPGDQPLALEPVCDNLRQRFSAWQAAHPDCTVVMELGRYLVAEAGVYVCRVSDRKTSRGQVYLITNGGLHHHLALSGNFGQVIRKNYPVCIGNRVHGDTEEVVNIVGPLCTPLDILGQRMSLPVAGIDDLIVVFQSGAYGFTASPHLFLSHPAPEELLL
ncbi:pyridoxal-dependent decarboxylase, exosortase A system-associated [Chromatocurvus halotolerans]|uniref:Diaminopimelate decarboxylase n=1 Tax=Chromatocurvus halotolerans TaxID=1132028 RepID=A0A4V2SB63_9GAMM|nr:pyridoxal-dependent decarboxylase, exosortase A system-associated [Chromatocurvus halotolerans]TCO74350.1 diaminopimelate decarboxylase [Chromatocurvus halotolerans]